MEQRLSALERTRTIPTGSGAPSGSPGDGAQYADITSGNYYVRENGVWVSYPRIVRGSVSSTGTVSLGTGFSTARTPAGGGTGDYTVTFSVAFAVTPVVKVGMGTGGTALFVKLHGGTAPNASSFRVLTFSDAAGTAADGGFTFAAMSQ